MMYTLTGAGDAPNSSGTQRGPTRLRHGIEGKER
jgi:hypothetical protein